MDAEKPRRGIRLLKSAANRFVFQSWPNGSPLESNTSVTPDTWYHLVVTKTRQDLTLYVQGKPESHGTPATSLDGSMGRPLFLGAQSGIPSFRGWLDEVAFYNRASDGERGQGPCINCARPVHVSCDDGSQPERCQPLFLGFRDQKITLRNSIPCPNDLGRSVDNFVADESNLRIEGRRAVVALRARSVD